MNKYIKPSQAIIVLLLFSSCNNKMDYNKCKDIELFDNAINSISMYQFMAYSEVMEMDKENPSYNIRYVKNIRFILNLNREFLNKYHVNQIEMLSYSDLLTYKDQISEWYADNSVTEWEDDFFNNYSSISKIDSCLQKKIVFECLIFSEKALLSNASQISLH